MFSLFLELRNNNTEEEIHQKFETYDINKLDINRVYRYIDKYINSDAQTFDNEIVYE